MTNLSVNLNKVALLRNQRDIGYPDLLDHAQLILQAGAHGLTVHPRPDERHIRKSDIPDLSQFIQQWHDPNIEFNIEGYPSDDFLSLVTEHPCDQVTLVPDAPDQKTSDHGWDVNDKETQDFLQETTANLHKFGRRVSLFLDPDPALIDAVIETGADRIELYTGPYAMEGQTLDAYIKTAQLAHDKGLGVNAGHDLNLDNLSQFIRMVPYCIEVSIGHALIADSLKYGWNATIEKYLEQIDNGKNKGSA